MQTLNFQHLGNSFELIALLFYLGKHAFKRFQGVRCWMHKHKGARLQIFHNPVHNFLSILIPPVYGVYAPHNGFIPQGTRNFKRILIKIPRGEHKAWA